MDLISAHTPKTGHSMTGPPGKAAPEGGAWPQALLARSRAHSWEAPSVDLETCCFNLGHGHAREISSLGTGHPAPGQASRVTS